MTIESNGIENSHKKEENLVNKNRTLLCDIGVLCGVGL